MNKDQNKPREACKHEYIVIDSSGEECKHCTLLRSTIEYKPDTVMNKTKEIEEDYRHDAPSFTWKIYDLMNADKVSEAEDLSYKVFDNIESKIREEYESVNNQGLSKKDLICITAQSGIEQMKAHEQRIKQSLIQQIREKIIEYPSGNCPSCVNGSNIHGLHPHDSLHHYMFYNKALDEVLTLLEGLAR